MNDQNQPQADGDSRQDGSGCLAVVFDLLTGTLEAIIIFITVTLTVVAIPPAQAPQAEYDHVVSTYTSVIMATVCTTFLVYIIRRRWVAVVIQVMIALIALASVLFLHHTRVTSGLNGY